MQRLKRWSACFMSGVGITAAVGCTGASEAPDVNYAEAAPLGRWQAEAAPAVPNATRGAAGGAATTFPSAAGALATAPVSSTSPGVAPSPASSSAPANAAPMPTAGSAAPPTSASSAGRAAMSGGAGSTATKPPAAGGPATEPAAGGAIKSLAFEVTTSPAGLRYQPKNIGAIWIQDSSGAVVKSLKVWARVRARWLTKYNAARAGAAVDVTASATLTNHQTHKVTWDLKDRSGATVAPGKYTLFAELTDGDATGKATSIEFDTSGAPKATTPANAPCFNDMKLELQ